MAMEPGGEDGDVDVCVALEIMRLDPSQLKPYPGEASVIYEVLRALVEIDDADDIEQANRLFQLPASSRTLVDEWIARGGP